VVYVLGIVFLVLPAKRDRDRSRDLLIVELQRIQKDYERTLADSARIYKEMQASSTPPNSQ